MREAAAPSPQTRLVRLYISLFPENPVLNDRQADNG